MADSPFSEPSRLLSLEEADRVRGEGRTGARRARECYLAHRGTLDPARPEDAARIRFVFESSPARNAEVEALAARAEAAPDPFLRDLARLTRAECASDLGRIEEAEERFRAVLRDHRGRGDALEFLACRDFTWFHLHRFREIEALALARRTFAVASASGDPALLPPALSALAGTYRALGDWERLEEVLDRLDGILPAMPPAAWNLRVLARGYRCEAALEREDPDAAEEHLRILRSGIPADDTGAFDHRWPLHLEGAIAWHRGRWEEGLALVARARDLPGRVPSGTLRLGILEIHLVLERDGPEAAVPLARRMLDALEADGPDAYGPGNRLRFGTMLGGLLRERCDAPEEARRAFDLAAAAVLLRLARIREAVRNLPEIVALDAEDHAILEAYRRRFLSVQGTLFRNVAALLEAGGAPGEAPIPGFSDADGMVAVCAWCRQVRDRDGSWIPVGVFLPREPGLRITHGICPPCLQELPRPDPPGERKEGRNPPTPPGRGR